MDYRMADPVVGSKIYRELYHELYHGETGKNDPLWGASPAVPVRPFHGGFGCPFMVIRVQFMVIWIHGDLLGGGARNSARYWTGTPTPS